MFLEFNLDRVHITFLLVSIEANNELLETENIIVSSNTNKKIIRTQSTLPFGFYIFYLNLDRDHITFLWFLLKLPMID